MSKDPAKDASRIAKEAARRNREGAKGDDRRHNDATIKQMRGFLGRHGKKN